MNNIIHESFKHGVNFKIGHFCVIEEDVVVGDNVKIDNYVLLKKGTKILDDVWVDSYVRSSGHNLIKANTTLRYGCTIAKEVVVEDGAFISPNVMTIYSTHTHKKSGKILMGWNLTAKSVKIWVEMINCGLKIGEFSACWTY